MRNAKRTLKHIYKLSVLLKYPIEHLVKLSNEQINYIIQPYLFSTFLEACPGSGKTEVIGLRSAKIIRQWKNVAGGIAVITFTKSAAKELSERVIKYNKGTQIVFPHFIGTFDGWLHNFIFQPFCHYLCGYKGKDGDHSMRLIDTESNAGFLATYSVSLMRGGRNVPIKANEYTFSADWTKVLPQTRTSQAHLATITPQELKLLKENKLAFISAGFATYSDAEILSDRILSKFPLVRQKIAKRFPVIFVDECQDLSIGQISLLNRLKQEGTALHFVGDLNQAIYEFRHVNPQDVIDYINNNKFLHYQLTHNFRSCKLITDLSSTLIGSANIEASVLQQSSVPCILWQYDDITFFDLPKKFEDLIISNNLSLEQSAIVARGASTLDPLKDFGERVDKSTIELLAIALHHWKTPNRSTDDITYALNYAGKFLSLIAYGGRGRKQEQYCPDHMSSIEWRILIKKLLNASIAFHPFQINGKDATWSAWAKIIKDFLQGFWLTFPAASPFSEASNKIRAGKGSANDLVNSVTRPIAVHNLIRTTTIHSVKGETLDAVMLVSHKNTRSQGGHYSHWLRETGFDEEHIRFAYVACSRPKQLLVVAVPMISNLEIQKLEKLGLVQQA